MEILSINDVEDVSGGLPDFITSQLYRFFGGRENWDARQYENWSVNNYPVWSQGGLTISDLEMAM